MAGVSTKEIKNRIRSMESTKQITKAMEMVAASKLRKAQTQVQNSRPYFETLCKRPVKKSAYVMIAGDRGLAGGYNSNVLKLTCGHMEGKDVTVLPIGKKSADYCRSRKLPVLTESYTEAEGISVSDCFTMARQLCKMYLDGQIDEIFIGFTDFVSVLSQTPSVLQVLPLDVPGEKRDKEAEMLYEPDSETVLQAIIPEYIGGVIYGCLCESRASEQAARRTAMDSATQNADEMIADLSLKFNRARQAAITQEITEIVAGS